MPPAAQPCFQLLQGLVDSETGGLLPLRELLERLQELPTMPWAAMTK
jgi:hypothetical protein